MGKFAKFPEYKKCFAWADFKCKAMTMKDCPNCNFYRTDIKYAWQVKEADAYIKRKKEAAQ